MPTHSFDPTLSLVRLALDASALEQAAIAHNIAHANTPGARVARVDFERQMAGVREHLARGGAAAPQMLDGAQPTVRWSTPSATAQAGQGLDAEIARMAENNVRYQTLLKALGHHFSVLSTAINEGRR